MAAAWGRPGRRGGSGRGWGDADAAVQALLPGPGGVSERQQGETIGGADCRLVVGVETRGPTPPDQAVPAPTDRRAGAAGTSGRLLHPGLGLRGEGRPGAAKRRWSAVVARFSPAGLAGPLVRSGAPLGAGTKSRHRAATPEFGVAVRFAASRESSSDFSSSPFPL